MRTIVFDLPERIVAASPSQPVVEFGDVKDSRQAMAEIRRCLAPDGMLLRTGHFSTFPNTRTRTTTRALPRTDDLACRPLRDCRGLRRRRERAHHRTVVGARPAVRERVVMATKFMHSPWKLNVTSALTTGPATRKVP